MDDDAAGAPVLDLPVESLTESWCPDRAGELPLGVRVALVGAVGLVEPLLVRPAPADPAAYEVVTGHRSLLAARLAGLRRVPAVVRRLDDRQSLLALALDAGAGGALTSTARTQLRARMLGAGFGDAEVDGLLDVLPGAEPAGGPPAPPPVEPWEGWTPAVERRTGRVSGAFADPARMLRLLAAGGFTGTVELAGLDGRIDVVALLEGSCVAVWVEEGGRPAAGPLRLPPPEAADSVEISVRPAPAAVIAAEGMAHRAVAVLPGLDASYVDLEGLVAAIAGRGGEAAIRVSAPEGTGVVLVAAGRVSAVHGRRTAAGTSSETSSLEALSRLLAGRVGEIDVVEPAGAPALDLEILIAAAASPGEGG